MPWSSDDTYLLELRGLGIVWRSRQAHSPALSTFGDPAPVYRTGIVAVGASLRSRISLFDARARAAGISVTLSGDSALTLLRAGGEPVRGPGGAAVYAVVPLDEYSSSGDTHLWAVEDRAFSGAPLTVGQRYVVGAEVIRIDSLDTTTAVGTRYNVTRGVRGSLTADRPVYWTEGQNLYRDPQEISELAARVDPIYPDLQPPTLTGWPVRLWRATAAGANVVVDGTVSRIRSVGANVVVEVASRQESEMGRRWAVPWGYMMGGVTPGAPTPLVPLLVSNTLSGRFDGQPPVGLSPSTSPPVTLGPNGGIVVAFPAASLPAAAANLAAHNAVLISPGGGEKWVAVKINSWLSVPWTPSTGLANITDDRFRYAELETRSSPEGGEAFAFAYGDGDEFGSQTSDTNEDLADVLEEVLGLRVTRESFSGYPWYFVDPEEVEGIRDNPAACYLLPTAGAEVWSPGILGPVEGAMGGQFRYIAGTCVRSPHFGRSVGEVVDVQLGAQGLARSVTPSGAVTLVNWLQPPPGSVAQFPAASLRAPVTTEIGDPGRVSRVTLGVRGSKVSIQVIGRSISPRGVEIDRDIDVMVTDSPQSQIIRAAVWSGAIARYRGTIPKATISVLDDGSGAVQALAPGVLVGLVDPALPAADGTRGFDGAALVLEVQVSTESRSAQIEALLIDYGRSAPRPWGPVVRVTTGDTGTTLTLQTEVMALGRGIDRYREILAVAQPDVILMERDGTIAATGTLVSMTPAGEADVAVSASSTVPAGALMVLSDATAGVPPAAIPFATAYYGVTEWQQ
jgi:hypothetical protein